MLTLVIAVRSSNFACYLKSALSSQFNIDICSTGARAQHLIETMQPDVLVLDLRLQDHDGISVLTQCNYKPPVILALTDLINSEVLQWAADTAIDALIMIPCSAEYVAGAILHILKKAPSPEP